MDGNSGIHGGRDKPNPKAFHPYSRESHPHHPRQSGPSHNNFSRPWGTSFDSRKPTDSSSNNRGDGVTRSHRHNRPFQQRAPFRPPNPLEEVQRRTWDEQQVAVGMKSITSDDANFVWGAQLPKYSAQEDETPLQRQQKRIHDEQKFELSLTTLATYSPAFNQSNPLNQSHRRYNRLLTSQTGNEPGFDEPANLQPFFQTGQFGRPFQRVDKRPPGQKDAVDEGRSLKKSLLGEAYQPGIRTRPVLEKSTVQGPHEVEPVFIVRNKDAARTGGVKLGREQEGLPMEVDENVMVENVTEGIELVRPENTENVLDDVISKIQAISLAKAKVPAVSSQDVALLKASPGEPGARKALMSLLSSVSTQPLRSLFMSTSFILYCSPDNQSILKYITLSQLKHEVSRKTRQKYRQLFGEEIPWTIAQLLTGIHPTKFYIMSSAIGEQEDHVPVLDKLRDKMLKKKKSLSKKKQATPYAALACAAYGCDKDALLGYCAGRVFNMKKPGLKQEVNEYLRFCEDHVGAALAHDICPHCRATSARQSEDLEQRVYCLGSKSARPNVRHFNHVGCMTHDNGKVEWACLHCGNDDQTRFESWEAVEPDWSRKGSCVEGKTSLEVFSDERSFLSNREEASFPNTHPVSTLWRPYKKMSMSVLPPKFLPEGPTSSKKGLTINEPTEGNAAKKFRETRSQRDRTKPILTTINLERPPLFYGTTSHFKDHAIVVGQVTAEEHKVQSRSRMVTVEKKMQATEKYAMALVSISGQCEGCLCGEVCVPGLCPCMSWYSASKGYNADHSLRLEGFDVKRDFARECSEVCLCNVNRCVNRATQAAPRVLVRDGLKLVLTKDVHEGDFLCRMAGELSDTRTDRPEEETFLLPKFAIWPPGCERFSMCYKNLQGPARLFRSATQYGRLAAVNVVPVMVLQSPLSVHIGNPRQLAIPVVAFFALKAMRAGEVSLVYETDFRDMNPRVPSLHELVKLDEFEGRPVEMVGTLFRPLTNV